MEYPDYAMGKRYADIMKTMWFTFFFSPAIPIGTLFSFFGLIAYYFTDKYNLIFRRTVKESIGPQLSFQMIELLEHAILFHCFGQFYFKWLLAHTVDTSSVVMFFIAFIISVLPMDKINDKLFARIVNQKEKYNTVEASFDTDYDRENPITRSQALQIFAQRRGQAKPLVI